MPEDPIQQTLRQAVALHEAQQFQQAEALYRQILAQHPTHPDALQGLGLIAYQFGQPAPAIDLIRRAIANQPNIANYHRNLATVLQSQRRFAEAADAWRAVMQLEPQAPDGPAQLGALLAVLDQHEAALQMLQLAAKMDPRSAGVHSNLGSMLGIVSRLEESITALQRAVDLQPDEAGPHQNLAVTLRQVGLVEEAEKHFREVTRINPAHAIAGSGLLLTLQYREHDRQQVFQEHLEWARRNNIGASLAAPVRVKDRRERLRVGYVSSDFRAHSVAYFIEPVLDAHDPAAVEVFCYSGVDAPDETTARLKKISHHWRDTARVSDDDLANQIRQDQIDVLVDLAGHTGSHRLRVFAMKPAPVQVTYLGYPDTTGLAQMDYRITDSIADPPDGKADEFYTERLVRLPRCAWCYRPPADAPEVAAPRFQVNGRITFGSFNNLAKVSPSVLDVWARILKELPTSRLLLKASGLQDPVTQGRVLSKFKELGVEEARVMFAGQMASLRDHLGAYAQVDIALDTYPYHGTTTSCEAMWMGVPVITLAGDRHVSRVGASLLNAVELDDQVARSPEEYVDRAVKLSHDRSALVLLRETMRERMRNSALCHARSLAQGLEIVFREARSVSCGVKS